MEDVYLSLFKNLEGIYLGHYGPHGFEIIELKYTLIDTFEKYKTHKLIATKLTGDTYVPKDQITFFIEHPANSNSTICIFPITGKGQIADFGFNNPRYINGKLISILDDFSAFLFQFGGSSFGFPMMYFRRDKKFNDLENISSIEESLTFNRMNDYAQSLSMQIDNIDYMVGGKKSASFSLIEECTDLFEFDENEPQDCVICLNKIIKEKCRKIKLCNHLFHQECIEKWLLRCKECPLCRQSIEKE